MDKDFSLFAYVLDWWASYCVAVFWGLAIWRQLRSGEARWGHPGVQLMAAISASWAIEAVTASYYWWRRYFDVVDLPPLTGITTWTSLLVFALGMWHVRIATYPEFRERRWLACLGLGVAVALLIGWLDYPAS